MTAPLRRFLRQLVPPVFTAGYRRHFRSVRFTGDYACWSDAAAASTGYDAENILQTVLAAARKVRDGEAAYDRDGVTFAEQAHVWPVVACLLRAAMKNRGELRVLDFGGALGSLYFQHRGVLAGVEKLHWAVVEQPMFVAAGKREFTTAQLTFHPDIADAVAASAPNVALLSGVVGWVEEPHALLEKIVAQDIGAVLLDRCAIVPGPSDRLTVQQVPASIYRASYPAWLMSREGLCRHFTERYELKTEFRSQDPVVDGVDFYGFYFERRA